MKGIFFKKNRVEATRSLCGIPITYCAHAISVHARGTDTREILSVSKPV